MNRAELVAEVRPIMTELFGEQFDATTDEDGDVYFSTMVAGIPVGLVAECLGEKDSLLVGHHVIGARVEDAAAAADFVANRNQMLRIGRVELVGDDVVFFHHVFGTGVNKDTLRLLLGLLAGASRAHADLAATTGALKLTDVAGIDTFDE